MFSLSNEKFQGPIEKLLELIEEKKLEVTEISLAQVTGEFMAYVETLKKESAERTEEEVRLMADFIAITAKLLLIKSKSLLPSLELSQEETEDIKDLENRLRFYQQFKPAIKHLRLAYQNNHPMASRPLFFGRPAVFHPSKNISIETLHKTMNALFETLRQYSLEMKTIEKSLITLEAKIEEIVTKLSDGIKHFSEVIKEKSKQEVVVLFLALLHLLREQIIDVEQQGRFSEIHIKKPPPAQQPGI